METRARAQCLVVRGNKILMVKHREDETEYFCLPGGGIEDGEMPEIAALRELREECLVDGFNLKQICESIHDNHRSYTFYADIGTQEPALGEDPEFVDNPILTGVEWRTLDSICERDRAYLWASGLYYIDIFAKELDRWGDDISYPTHRKTPLPAASRPARR